MIELYDIPYKSVRTVLNAAMRHLGVSEEDISAEIASLPDEEIHTLNRNERGVERGRYSSGKYTSQETEPPGKPPNTGTPSPASTPFWLCTDFCI